MNFVIARNNFDRVLRKTERTFNNKIVTNIENSCNTNNSKEFWNYISKLSPRKCSNIPIMYGNENNLTTNLPNVLNKWKNYFCSLYNRTR